MIPYLLAYAFAAVAFVAGDITWLTVAGQRLYRPVIGPLLADKLNGGAGVVFYVVYLSGVVILAIGPALRAGSLRMAAVNGLVLGLVAYGTYDLTNQATLRLWSTRLTLIDMTWGGCLTAAAAAIGFLAASKLGR